MNRLFYPNLSIVVVGKVLKRREGREKECIPNQIQDLSRARQWSVAAYLQLLLWQVSISMGWDRLGIAHSPWVRFIQILCNQKFSQIIG